MIVVDTVIGSSNLEKSDDEMSFSWNSHFIKLFLDKQKYFLKLLNCSVGFVGKENDADVTVLLPLNIFTETIPLDIVPLIL